MEKIEKWIKKSVNEKIHICFDNGTKYIELSERDVRNMLDWIEFEKLDSVKTFRENMKKKD